MITISPSDTYLNLAPRIVRKNRQPTTPLSFHRRLSGYSRTPLVPLSDLARALDVARISVKVESNRFGLPSFKILGASWAIYRELSRRLPGLEYRWETIEDLRREVAELGRITFVAATDGNHGRAVAHMAALLGQSAHILVPADMAPARIAAIESEGANVTVINGTYDDAIVESARLANDHHLVISDTSWEGYTDIPSDVIDGYSTIFNEIETQMETVPTQVMIQVGVGALASAAIRSAMTWDAKVVSVEPADAACVLASLREKRSTDVPGPHRSIMAGLNCGAPSMIAWPELWNGIDLATAIPDDAAREAMRVLANAGIIAGETGAAGLAGLLSLAAADDWPQVRRRLKMNHESHILAIVTEGATDVAAWEAITGHTVE